MGAGGVRPRPELLLGLAVDLSDPDTWFVSAAPGPRQGHDENRSAEAVIYRWRGTGPWQALSEGLPQSLKSLPAAPATAPGWLLAGFSTGVSMRAGTVERTESNCPSAAMSFPMCRRSQWWIEDDPRFQGRRRDWQQTRLNFPPGQLSQGQPYDRPVCGLPRQDEGLSEQKRPGVTHSSLHTRACSRVTM
jgi:hypothetical protein